MIDKRTYKARMLSVGMDSKRLAEMVGAAVGESVPRYEIQRCFDYKCDYGRIREIREAVDSITRKEMRKKELAWAKVIERVLADEGDPVVQPLRVEIANPAYGERLYVFINGDFYGVFNPVEMKWGYRHEKD